MKPETKQMNKAGFMKMLASHPGATDILTEIVAMAKSDGFAAGFDAGYANASESNDMYSYDGE